MGKKIIVDSDVLVALFKPDDFSHEKAKDLIKNLRSQRYSFLCLNLVSQESTTVISNRLGMTEAKKFHEGFSNFIDQIIPLDDRIEQRAWEIFLDQSKKGTSFVDCANIACVEVYRLDGILSFDQAYPKELRVGW